MKVRHINTAYEVGGYVFEVGEEGKFSLYLKTLGSAETVEEAEKKLKTLGLPYKKFKAV